MITLLEDLLQVRLDIVMAISITIMYLVYYLVEVVKRPVVVGGGSVAALVRAEVRAARGRYWVAPWCVHAHLQSAAAALLRARLLPAPAWRRRLVRLADGGTVALEWAGGEPGPGARRVLLLLPGLAGGASADYARLAAAAAARLRAHLALLVYRGLHGLPLTTDKMYSALSYEDVGAVVRLLRRRHGRARLGALGVSLGGLLLGGLAARGGGGALAGALLLGAPLDVQRGARAAAAARGGAALGALLAARLRAAVAPHRAVLAAHWPGVAAARSLRQFDAALTAPALGLPSPDAYYAAASLRPHLRRLAVPTLAVCAADDPFQPLHVLPVREAAAAQHAALLVCARGGHVGLLDVAGAFLPRLLHDYFAGVLRRPRSDLADRDEDDDDDEPGARYLSADEVRADPRLLAALRCDPAAPADLADPPDPYDPYGDEDRVSDDSDDDRDDDRDDHRA